MMYTVSRSIFFTLFSLMLLSVSAPAVAPGAFIIQQYDEERPTHTVEPGETLFAISRMYEVEVSQLREWNELESDNLRPGQRLFVGPEDSGDEASAETSQEFLYHTVQQGETLFALSRRYEAEPAQIMEWNDMEDASLQIGQQLIVGLAGGQTSESPAAEEAEEEENITAIPPPEDSTGRRDETAAYALEEDSPSYQYYEVKAGDTLSGISRQFGMPLGQLREMNELQNDALSIGQRLVVGQQETTSGLTGLQVESTAQGRFYTYEVKQDDDIERLMEQHQMDALDFEVLNPGLPAAAVTAGQQIILLAPPTSARPNPYLQRGTGAPAGQGENLMRATVYSQSERGKTTTTGELYNPDDLTAAHPSLPLGSVVFVGNASLPRGIFVLINDRTSDSRLKLSQKAFEHLELARSEAAEVLVLTRLDQ